MVAFRFHHFCLKLVVKKNDRPFPGFLRAFNQTGADKLSGGLSGSLPVRIGQNQHFSLAAGILAAQEPSGNHLRIVDNQNIV